PAAPAPRGAWLPWSVAAALALALLGALATSRRKPETPARAVRFTLSPPPGSWYSALQSLSPDGTRLFYATLDAKGKQTFWIRPLDEIAAKPVQIDAQYIRNAFWSPDGKSLAFGTRSRLVRVDIADGRMRSICDAPLQFGGTWSALGDILFVPAYGSPIN